MKEKIFTLMLSIVLLSFSSFIHAQLIFEEYFDYEGDRPLVMDAVPNSDNFDGVTGWSTQSNSKSGDNCFDLLEGPMIYNGYIASGLGNSLKYNGGDGQGVFKLFNQNVRNDSIVYMSFIINFPSEVISGGDYFLGFKMEPSAASTNWGARLFASVDPNYANEEVSLGINKMSGGGTTWVNQATGPFLPVNTSHLLVMKYHIGVLNGNSAAEEAGKYDDIMYLYINPELDGEEPEIADIMHQDATQKDLYRYTDSGMVFGGARGLYLRASAEGNAPAYTIGGIRVGLSWSDVLPPQSGLKQTSANNFTYRINNKQINIESSLNNYDAYALLNLAGQEVLSGTMDSHTTTIDASRLPEGVYVINLRGNQQAAAKIIVR